MRRVVARVAGLLLVVGCGMRPSGRPPGDVTLRGPTDKAACGAVDGSYQPTGDVMNAFLLRGTFGRSLRQVWVDSVSIRGAASHSIVLTAVHGDVRDTVLLQQGTDYTCDGGWLVMMAELYNQDFPEELKAAIDADRGNDFVFAMAGDTRGRLIGRVTQETFRTISVWCGDGCRSGKVPFTSHFRTYWYSWEKPGEWSAEAKEDSSRTERLLDEEYMLENGTPRPRPPRPSPR